MPGGGLFTGSDGTVDGDLACIAAEWGESTAELCRRFIFNPKELPGDPPNGKKPHWSTCTGYTDGTVGVRFGKLKINPHYLGANL